MLVNNSPISTKQTTTSHLKSMNTKTTTRTYMTVEIHILAWDRCKNVAVLNHLMDPNLPLPDNWISKDNTDIKKTYFKKTYRFASAQ